MISSLNLINWRTHSQTKLEFGKGTNVIVGVMGSGKSSIVNAICYSLFGTFPALKNRSISLEEVIMNKPNIQNFAQTTIEFKQENKTYRVERIIKRDSTNEAKLYENDKLIAGPKQKDVNENVENLLGINYELFSRAVYSEQNEMDFFLKLSPSERKKKFDELLELEKYESARKNAISLQNDLAKENKQRKELIGSQKEAIKSHEEEKILNQIKEEEKILLALEKEHSELTKIIPKIEKTHSDLVDKEKIQKTLEETKMKTIERINSLHEFLSKNKIVNEIKIQEELKEQNQKIKEENELLAKISNKLDELIKKEKENKLIEDLTLKITSKIETLKEELTKNPKTNLQEQVGVLEKITKEIEEFKLKLITTEKEEKEILLTIKKSDEEIKVIEHEKRKITAEEIEISNLKGKCPTCKQELNEEHKIHLTKELTQKFKEFEKQMIGFIQNKKETEGKLKITQTEKEEIRKIIEEKTKQKYEIEANQKRLIELEEKGKMCKTLEEELPKLRKQLQNTGFNKEQLESTRQSQSELNKKISEIKSQILLKEMELKLAVEKKQKEEQLEKENLLISKTEEEIKKNSFDKKELEKIRGELNLNKTALAIAQEKIKSKNELKQSYELTLEKITQIKKSIKEQEEHNEKSTKASEKLGIFANCLIATQIELREAMLDTINQAMTNIWQEVYPYSDFIDARLCVVEEGYDLQVLTRGNEWTRVEGILSGGERSAAALCIRIAFALVLTKKLSMLILDEPTHNLDSNAVSKLSEMLREKLPKLVEQIFVITHDKNLESAASCNLYLLKRDKNSDESTKVENIDSY
jgi:DNA repair protein SbcC/Rad50